MTDTPSRTSDADVEREPETWNAEPTWYGFTRLDFLSDEGREAFTTLADAARDGRWDAVFAVLDADPRLVNVFRPGGRSGFAPLHQAAYHGDAGAVDELLRRGGWLALRSADGERPADVARRRAYQALAERLEPRTRWATPSGVVHALEQYLHAVIRVRADRQVREASLRLPPVEPLLGMEEPRLWFPVPGMYGGFSLRLLRPGVHAELQVESWCRVVDGSGQRHLVTGRGVQLVAEGFV
jgi:hypothetical protein